MNALANIAGLALRREHDRGLLSTLADLLVEKCGADGRKARSAALHVVPVVVRAVV